MYESLARRAVTAVAYGAMTIGTIFERYDVPADIQARALARGAYVLALQRAWVGPDVSWSLIVKTLIFADLGETSAHIRKKVGLDKYAVTLITRGVSKYAHIIAESHDWHQKLYLYCAYVTGVITSDSHSERALELVTAHVQHNLLNIVPIPSQAPPDEERTLRTINILHYKNPSV
jgi:hypothetical protein